MTLRLLTAIVATALLHALMSPSTQAAQRGGTGPLPDHPTILVTTGAFGGGGALVSVEREQPWTVTPVATLNSADARVQTFNGFIYVIEPDTDLIRVFDGSGAELRSFSVGAGTSPRDILGVARNRAYVSRANATSVYRVDPQTGAGSEVIDLSMFADGDGVPEMERMASDGTRLFIQLRQINFGRGRASGSGTDGVIAVVDLATETLIDADPSTKPIDAIELTGPAPRLRMHVDAGLGYLLVSATDGNHLSFNGGIEFVSLQTLSTAGFVVDELSNAALGGFVVTEHPNGYFLFHTDIIASNHLKRFTITDGADPAPEIVFDGGAYLDALLFDTETDLLYMPASVGGLYVVDTQTDMQVTAEPIALPGVPVDQVIGPVGNPADVTGDGVVSVFDLLVLLGAWGNCPVSCPPSCLADVAGPNGSGSDCTVNVLDLLELLSNWG